ncbi:hypothetical protein CHISP_3405 [Chitinispirillum alkaliphilum]|nr:hypothetical protein CHISP_3405 [Chitinispirillum alkaliphilum]
MFIISKLSGVSGCVRIHLFVQALLQENTTKNAVSGLHEIKRVF